ncbi:MAG: hypothetical protein LC685_00230 [Actinobacteria bacterium]|nr:hypothetical protein [Actinomycetota bacterium]
MPTPLRVMTTRHAHRAATPSRAERPFSLVAVVIVVGALGTAGLTLASAALYTSNEHRLLNLRARDVGAVLTEALPSIQTPLTSAVALADATSGDMAKFKRFAAPYVGTGRTRTFIASRSGAATTSRAARRQWSGPLPRSPLWTLAHRPRSSDVRRNRRA